MGHIARWCTSKSRYAGRNIEWRGNKRAPQQILAGTPPAAKRGKAVELDFPKGWTEETRAEAGDGNSGRRTMEEGFQPDKGKGISHLF